MQFDHFMGQVQHRAKLPTMEDAIIATRATLATLSERLTGSETRHLSAQLPTEIKGYLKETEGSERLGVDEFFKRISEREGRDLPESVYHARVVFSVLKEAITEGEWEDIKAQLPEEYCKILESGYEGKLSF